MNDKDYWERHAGKYDASVRWTFGKPLSRMSELCATAVRGKQLVLEVAAGTGIVTSAIAGTCESVVATDYARAMVDVLGQRIRDEGLNNVRPEQADIYALSYPVGEFDAVVAANVLHIVPDLPAAIEALRRVTKPGGKLVAPTFCHDETKLSWLASRLFAVTGFPANRRFTLQSLRAALENHGILGVRATVLPGLIPIGFVEGTFPPDLDGHS